MISAGFILNGFLERLLVDLTLGHHNIEEERERFQVDENDLSIITWLQHDHQ